MDIEKILFIAIGIFLFYLLFLSVKLSIESKKRNAEMLEEPEEDEGVLPEIQEYSVTVIGKRCEVNTYGSKPPRAQKEFYLGFRTDDGKELIFSVGEESYLEVEEGQKGTVAVLNDNYYGFCADE